MSFLGKLRRSLPRDRKRPSSDDVTIFVANHRLEPFDLPAPYAPLLVGAFRAEDAEGFAGDLGAALDGWSFDCAADGGGISQKNASYCELTGLWWIWKAYKGNGVVGLMHYRRLLGTEDGQGGFRPLAAAEMADALEGHDCLVAKREHFKYPIAHDYNLCHQLEDLEALRIALQKEPSRYMRAFHKVMDSNSLHPYNILVARRELFDGYCAWLFGVLDRVEGLVDPFAGRDPMQVRVFGFLAERLLNIWLEANELSASEFPIWSPMPNVMAEASERYSDVCEAMGYPPVDTDVAELLAPLPDFGFRFDHGFYVRTYDDVWSVIGDNPDLTRDHAQTRGLVEKRVTSPFGTAREYMNAHPALRAGFEGKADLYDSMVQSGSLAEAGIDARGEFPMLLSRNKVLGVTELDGVDYSPVYDYAYYVGRYDDVPRGEFDSEGALRHFVDVGMGEGRVGSAAFDVRRFKRENPDMAEELGTDFRPYYMRYIESLGGGDGGANSRESAQQRYRYCI